MNKLKILTSTNRSGAKGKIIANWICQYAKQNSDFEVELLDLAKIDLPFMNEPNHPVLKQYEFEHTKKWSATIEEADCFIIVLSEYNYGYPAPIKNAIDYLHSEWKYKPVGFVSYGGISGGLRAVQMLKQVLTTLSMMPLVQQVSLPFFAKQIDENGIFHPNDSIIRSTNALLAELEKWSFAMKEMRTREIILPKGTVEII